MYKELQEVRTEMLAEGMFELGEVEVRGQKLKTFKNAPNSLRDIWAIAGFHADREYLVYEEERWTYTQAQEEVAAIANWVQAQGIKQGERVAIAMRNYPEWMLWYWALTSIGVTVVGMNAWWVADEMDYALKDSAPRALVCDQERLEVFQTIADDFPDMKLVGVRLKSKPNNVVDHKDVKATGGALPEVSIDGDEDACIFYTSGTTGRPKGAQLTQRGCVINVMNVAFMTACAARAAARADGTEADLPPIDQAPPTYMMVTTPLFHVTANNCAVQPATLTGGKVVCMYRWDAGEALKLVEREKITSLGGVPVMAREVIAHPDFDKYDTSTLTMMGGGGSQLQPDLVAKIDSSVKNAKPLTGYGMTETCGIITAVSGAYFIDKPESAGPFVPTLDGKCIDSDGKDVPMGELGEICVRGANVIKGYLNRPEATEETIENGWLRTGDIGRIDEDGFVYIVDRAKDMVLRGGENIYCAEVESAIFKHDAVAECVAFGVPDDRLGEEVGAAIVIAEGKDLSADEIRAHCATLISKFKIPRYIWLRRDLLPRNASGKFLKREMRDTLDTKDAA